MVSCDTVTVAEHRGSPPVDGGGCGQLLPVEAELSWSVRIMSPVPVPRLCTVTV